ncbi:MAG: magnesium/cobalt transporter CorA [Trueperaceae bacterium]
MRYDEASFEERVIDDPADLEAAIAGAGVVWVNVVGVHDTELLTRLGDLFALHPLTVEDLASVAQRPKVEEYGEYVYVVARMMERRRADDPGEPSAGNERTSRPGVVAEDGVWSIEQLSMVLRGNLLVTFQESPEDPFGPVRERLRRGQGRVRKLGADYLAYALLDLVVDRYFTVMEYYGDRIETLEEVVLRDPSPDVLEQVNQLRRALLLVRRAAWPLRDVLSELRRDESPFIGQTVATYLRDAHDHTVQVLETLETLREMATSLHDVYLTSLSLRMNDVMRVLTIIATIFIPLTFLAGIYGMNFDVMPELHWRWAYPLLWLIMLVSAGGMLLSFRRRKWI